MKLTAPSPTSARSSSAFSLTELLVAVGLLSVIVFALYAIFDQTQKALRANLQQSEMNEAARPALDLMVRDIEGAEALGITNGPNLLTAFTRVVPAPLNLQPGARFQPLFQSLFFFAGDTAHRFRSAGFFVANPTNAGMDLEGAYVGTLYKYADSDVVINRTRLAVDSMAVVTNHFLNPQAGANAVWRRDHSSRLVDGVVHFRVTPCDPEGLGYDFFTYPTNRLAGFADRVILRAAQGGPVEAFYQDRLPAFVELELGVLDSKTLDQYRSLAEVNPAQALAFLERSAGKVQIFRQRVVLRAALR